MASYLPRALSASLNEALDHAERDADEGEPGEPPAQPDGPAGEDVLPVRHRFILDPAEDHDGLQEGARLWC